MANKQGKTLFVCGECGHESAKWLGKCPACGSWNTMVEAAAIAGKPARGGAMAGYTQAVSLSEVETDAAQRVSCGMPELDRVLGGGLVRGSTVLIGGDPGIGKSTLLMQAAAHLASCGRVLYVTGEESAAQLRMRAARLGVERDMLVLAQTDLSCVESEAQRLNPDFLIIDSIQTMYCADIPSAAGSVSQVREATAILTRYAKSTACAVFIVGHVTKEGALAGPRLLEHMVDTVLYFEGDRHDAYRLLRAVKNRFGSTDEIGVFEMRDVGMVEIPDPSRLFLTGTHAPGCAVTCAMEGTRPMLAEVQALLSPTAYSNPRRMATGVDGSRLALLLAVLEKKADLRLCDKDVYINVVGGLRINERACDLAVAMCVASALLNIALPPDMAVLGELSLTGEVRAVSRMDKRVQECARLGFSRVLLPAAKGLKPPAGMTLMEARTLSDALRTQM